MEYTLGIEYRLYVFYIRFKYSIYVQDLCLLVFNTKMNVASSTEEIIPKKINLN